MGTKRIMLTGGTGFIGANLARTLLHEDYDVGIIYKDPNNLWRLKEIWEKITPIYADITRRSSLKKVIKKYNPEFIFHLATYGSYPGKQKEKELIYKTNFKGTKNIVELAGDIPIINVGTSSEYGPKEKPMHEDMNCYPQIDYGHAKLRQTEYCQKNGIPTLRFFSVYGPFEDPERLIPVLINAKIKLKPLQLINSVRDYLHVEDVSLAFLKCIQNYKKISGEIINIASGQQTSMRELLEVLNEINPSKLKIDWNFKKLQPEPEKWMADNNKSKKILDYSPKISLKKGLRQTYSWWSEFNL